MRNIAVGIISYRFIPHRLFDLVVVEAGIADLHDLVKICEGLVLIHLRHAQFLY